MAKVDFILKIVLFLTISIFVFVTVYFVNQIVKSLIKFFSLSEKSFGEFKVTIDEEKLKKVESLGGFNKVTPVFETKSNTTSSEESR